MSGVGKGSGFLCSCLCGMHYQPFYENQQW